MANMVNPSEAPGTVDIQAGIDELSALQAKHLAGKAITTLDVVKSLSTVMRARPVTLAPLLSLLTLQGKPYSIRDYFPFEPIFKLAIPRRIMWKCGRQVAKSTGLSSSGIMRSAGTPFLRTLYVTPRFEQVRRLSTNYVGPFIRQSLIKALLVNEECTQHVLQRSFINMATLFFSFAFLDVDRIRGISCDIVKIDEVQDMDYDFIPIILECMSASQFGVSFYSGTPKTLDNSIEALWESSSKAEWVTKCTACNYYSMAALHADSMKMIGSGTVICAKCQRPINPRAGHWYHTDGKARPNFHGYHVPQIIMPMHYENIEKWKELVNKRDGKDGYSPTKFLNEVMGESADIGVKLITSSDIRAASVLGKNDLDVACEKMKNCRVRVVGVDWGGGGEEEVSFTTITALGLNSFSGKLECHYCFRFHASHSHDEEASEIMKVMRGVGAHYLAHDFGGSGSVRETLMIQAGWPINKIFNCLYVRASTRNIVHYNTPPHGELRGFYSIDKARSLVLQATCLKAGLILLPEYDSSKNVTNDLLNLIEDKHEMPKGSDIFLIKRRPKTSDDFAHALNFASLCIWHTEKRYPDLSVVKNMKLSKEQIQIADPRHPWKKDESING